jgi:putative DNA primase/helicase
MSDARRKLHAVVRGEDLNSDGRVEAGLPRVLPPPSAPMAAARELVADRYAHDDGSPTLQHWRGGWWEWRRSHWAEIEPRAVAAVVYDFTENAVYSQGDSLAPWDPTKYKVANVLDALAAIVHLAEDVDQPSWTNGHAGHDGAIVACANGLLDVASRELLVHHPHYFNSVAVPFEYDPAAPAPARWLAFMADLWGDDTEQVAALQEWAGYLISGRLDFQKILLLVGPTRAGKA